MANPTGNRSELFLSRPTNLAKIFESFQKDIPSSEFGERVAQIVLSETGKVLVAPVAEYFPSQRRTTLAKPAWHVAISDGTLLFRTRTKITAVGNN